MILVPHSRLGASAGFTMLELLVVIAVLSLVIAIALPYLPQRSSVATVQTSARAIAGGLREARSQAIHQSQPATFALDVASRRWWLSSGRSGKLPDDLAITIETGRNLVRTSQVAMIRFLPDGSSSGGRIELRAAGARVSLAVDWLTGAVSAHD
jgi:general secretion pathway protein H